MKKKSNRNLFYLALGLTVLDLAIPDPLPVIDEVVLSLWTVWLGTQQMKGEK